MALLTLLAVGAACRTVAQPGGAAPPLGDPQGGKTRSAPPRENAIDTGVDAGPPAVVRVETPPRWGKLPETSGELFAAVDGDCSHLGVSVLENETFVHYGHSAVLGRVTDDAIIAQPAFREGLGNVYNVGYVAGRWPDQAYLSYDNGGRCSFTNLALRFEGGKWKNAFALPENLGVDQVQVYMGGAIGLRTCPQCGDGGGNACVPGVFMGDNAKAPPIAGDGFTTITYEVSGSDVFALGAVCPKGSYEGCGAQFRWWSPGAKVGYSILGPITGAGSASQTGSIFVKSKTEVYVAKDQYFAMFDGTKLTKLAAPGKTSNRLLGEAKDGGLWLEADNKIWQRKAGGTYEDVTPPSPPNMIAGLKQGAPWALMKNAVYKRIGATWQKVELPRPPFSATASKAYLTPESITVRAADDVFIVAS